MGYEKREMSGDDEKGMGSIAVYTYVLQRTDVFRGYGALDGGLGAAHGTMDSRRDTLTVGARDPKM